MHNKIFFAVPGAKKYFNYYFSNHPGSFVNLSLTGTSCALNCAHCNAKLLHDMVDVHTPQKFKKVIDHLVRCNCQGILISGGANQNGEVPILPFIDAIAYAREKGLKVIAHTGLITRETARALKQVGVSQVLLDIIGDQDTINRVYHLQKKPEDYLEAMLNCREAGIPFAPHIVIGLHYGQIKGEMKALDMIKKAEPDILVLVVLTPMPGTMMASISPPSINKTEVIIARAREENPQIPVNLGCARPPGEYKKRLERIAVANRLNAIAYPDVETITYAREQGLDIEFVEACCSLVTEKYPGRGVY
ncbi:MAG: radical SAM protein [Syntrophomonadaceae bacterium]|nr:radical SAM protein [Syntrophomonadaceae bacterium]MDD3890156.1 radical SAM protein [Syntrophomonadaceae bacterium]